jgi:hypothetical protein
MEENDQPVLDLPEPTATDDIPRARPVSAMETSRDTLRPTRNAHSTSPTSMGRFEFPPQNDSDTSDPMDTEEEEEEDDDDDEVSFWGGQSPREGNFLSQLLSGGESDSESENSEDENMEEDEDDDDDDDDNEINIFGHR